mgnify:CR=1 FL=1
MSVYLIWSFVSGKWGTTWVVFIAAAILTAVGNVVVKLLCVGDDEENDSENNEK